MQSLRSCPSAQRIEAPSDVRESGAPPMIVRALPLALTYAMRLNAFLPIAGLIDRVAVRVVGDETSKTPVGDFDAWASRSTSAIRAAGCESPKTRLIRWSSISTDATAQLMIWRATSPTSRLGDRVRCQRSVTSV